ncbi:MAG TPA: hypothetical protein VIK86_07820 [Candidatus Paceibacterota bacterium]
MTIQAAVKQYNLISICDEEDPESTTIYTNYDKITPICITQDVSGTYLHIQKWNGIHRKYNAGEHTELETITEALPEVTESDAEYEISRNLYYIMNMQQINNNYNRRG